MLRVTVLLGFILLTACQPANEPQGNAINSAEIEQESARLNVWFERKYEQLLQHSPMTMTRLGVKDRYEALDDFSESFAAQNLEWWTISVAELKANFDYNKLDKAAKTSYQLWLYQFEMVKQQYTFRRSQYVFTQVHGPQTTLPGFLINYHSINDVPDILAYISRLQALGVAIEQLLVRARNNADEGTRPPYFSYDAVIDQAKRIIANQPFDATSSDSPLLADAKRKIQGLLDSGNIDPGAAAYYTEQVEAALLQHVLPSYQALIAWFEQDKASVSSAADSANMTAGGDAYYRHVLHFYTTTDVTADAIHQMGLAEVARIRGEMEAIKQRVGFDGNLSQFFEFIQQDPTNEQFYYPDTDDGRLAYLADARSYLQAIETKLPSVFGVLPKASLIVKRAEPFRAQSGEAQHYYPGTPDGSKPGIYYVDLADMTAMPKHEMEALIYHQGNPGHHLQVSIAHELTGVPTFRKYSSYASYTEGWVLYAELLAKELGAYQDPYSEFGRLVTELWRAMRLVVDTGIHAKGWSEEQAIQYFTSHSYMAEAQIRSLVRRCFEWPAQATAYAVGMAKIQQLRTRAQGELGSGFELRDFHDAILTGGAMPLHLLEQRMEYWLHKKKNP